MKRSVKGAFRFGFAAVHLALALPLLERTVFEQMVFAQVEAKSATDAAAMGSDPVFATIPFDRWVMEGEPGHFHWTAHVTSSGLSHHQRLLARFEVQVDGNEMVSRKGHGQLLLMVQFTDGDNRVFQTHQALNLDEVKDETAKSNITYSQQAFVTPGDYKVSFAVVDVKTGEHGVLQRPLHVSALHNDPLPNAWTGVPAVEFEREVRPPDQLFLPYMAGRLRLPLQTARPVHIDLLVNAAAAEGQPLIRMLGPLGQTSNPGPRDSSVNQKLGAVIAAMKVMSEIDLSPGTLRISMLDLARRKVVFDQHIARRDALGKDESNRDVSKHDAASNDESPKDKPGSLDWQQLRGALQEADPNKIDVGSLAHRDENAQFFVDQVFQRTKPAEGAQQVLIVLSSPTPLSGEDQRAILAAQRASAKVYFVRYHALPPAPPLGTAQAPAYGRRGGGFPPSSLPASASAAEPFDSLGALLKPLQPRVFDVYSPEQFRKALAAMMDEIAKM